MSDPTLPQLGDASPGWITTLHNAILAAYRLAQQALAAATGVPGVVQVDSFPGATDAAKMSAALAYAAAQPRTPWLQLPARVFDTGTATFSLFTGCKIKGAGHNSGPQNEEISSGKGVTGKWKTSCGSLGASLLQATTTVYDVNLSGIVFHGASGSQILRSTVNMYACSLNNLTFYGCKHAIGAPTEKFLMTQHHWDGHWTILSFTDTQITAGGGDSWFDWYINSNSPPATAGAGRPIIDMQGMGKSDMSFPYLTAENDWIALRVNGGGLDKSLFLQGGVQEGRSPTNLATRPLIDLVSGYLVVSDLHCGQVSSSVGTVSGVIHQRGGRLVLNDTLYLPGSGVPDTFPLVYQTAGSYSVNRPVHANGGQIRLRQANGTTDTLPLPTNSYTP